MKRLLLFAALVATTSMACSSCGPAELETESAAVVEEEPWPFVTWEDCSQAVGDHPCNFTLLDQDNKEISLYDFYGSTVILDLSAMWCGPCQMAGSDVQNTIERFADEDIRYVTVLIENLQGDPPNQSDVQSWAMNLGIETEPILQGSRSFLSNDATIGWPLESWPTFVLITSEMEVYIFQKGYNQQVLDMLIEDTILQTQ
jgi:thiol-disulfide isomerase/thioredoxin